jgi:hypothetical protein
MGAVSIGFYVILAAISDNILGDSASAVGLLIAFYYGLTGFAAAWYFRRDRGHGFRELSARVLMPLAGGLMLAVAFVKTLMDDANPDNSDTVVSLFGWDTGGIFVIAVGSLVLGVIFMLLMKWRSPAFFTGSILNRDTVIQVLEGVSTRDLTVPALPDAPSLEQTVVPPMSVEELRDAAAEAREERRGDGSSDS